MLLLLYYFDGATARVERPSGRLYPHFLHLVTDAQCTAGSGITVRTSSTRRDSLQCIDESIQYVRYMDNVDTHTRYTTSFHTCHTYIQKLDPIEYMYVVIVERIILCYYRTLLIGVCWVIALMLFYCCNAFVRRGTERTGNAWTYIRRIYVEPKALLCLRAIYTDSHENRPLYQRQTTSSLSSDSR